MKSIVFVALALVAIAVAAPVEEPIKIIRSDFQQSPEGGYQFQIETANGINQQEVGEVKEVLDADNKPQKVVVVRGSYSYINNEGNPETINYSADEFGFKADGPSVPKPVEAGR